MFSRLRVLELASVLAGPSVGQFFAELGAEVIKVENPSTGGDVTRSWKTSGENTDDRSAYFCACNWGKKSIALDLTLETNRVVLRKLAAQSDIVVASYKPGDAAKLGVDYTSLSAENPALIYGQITGYGSEDERTGYDAVVQAESGFMDLNGEAGGPPTKMPVALIDVLAAHQLKEGLLLALLRREETGKGDFTEVSLIQTAIASLVNQATNWLVAGKMLSRQGSAHPNIAPYGDSFETLDNKRLILAIGSDRQFKDLLSVLKVHRDPNLETDRYSTNQRRVENRVVLNQLLASAIRLQDSVSLLVTLRQRKIPAGIIHTIQETFELPQANELLLHDEGLIGVRGFVARSTMTDAVRLSAPPHLGEHTHQILSWLKG